MSFVVELLSATLARIFGRAAHARNRAITFLMGTIFIIVSLLLIYLYSFVYIPVPVGNYLTRNIRYEHPFAEGAKNGRRIVLAFEGRSFKIDHHLWPSDINETQLLELLTRDSVARLWMKSPDDIYIQGIETSSFRIDPSVGAEWDNSNRRYLLWIGIGLSILGITTVLSAFRGK